VFAGLHQLSNRDEIFWIAARKVGYQIPRLGGCWWLTSVILAEIGRITVQGQPRQILENTPSPK
jgi:hypothetical protein